MRIIPLIILIIFFYSLNMPLNADENNYRHIAVLGFDKSVSNSDETALSPVIAYYYIRDDLQNNLYFQFTLTTTILYFMLAEKPGVISPV